MKQSTTKNHSNYTSSDSSTTLYVFAFLFVAAIVAHVVVILFE